MILQLKFVDYIPERLRPGILYVSMEYSTAAHLCPCGCNKEVVTPLSPKGWQLSYDGEVVSLWPSVGNRQLPCRSHYFIVRNRILVAGPLDDEKMSRTGKGKKRKKSKKGDRSRNN
jgi:hypothetical protein